MIEVSVRDGIVSEVSSAGLYGMMRGGGGAMFSPCRQYRYFLRRGLILRASSRPAVFCMLTPSTADSENDDASSRRICGYARSWHCDSAIIINAHALISTDPAGLRTHCDPIGPKNDFILRSVARQAHFAPFGIICAWGKHAKPERVEQVLAIFRAARIRLTCLAQCADGTPKHPLYLRGDLTPRDYDHDATASAPAGPPVTQGTTA